MDTWFKYGSIVLVWVGMFSLSFFLMNSQAEEEVLRLQKLISGVQDWKTYTTTQTVLMDDQEQINLQSIFQQDPYSTWVSSKAKLTDTEDFKFDVYFQPDVIYIHALNSNIWNKVDYTHPVAGQLEGLKDPLAIWQRLLKSAKKVEWTTMDNNEHYRVQLSPFTDELHGIRLVEVKGGSIEIWAKNHPFEMEKMKMEIQFKPNILRGYDKMTYLLQFSNQNKEVQIVLPKEAESAETMN